MTNSYRVDVNLKMNPRGPVLETRNFLVVVPEENPGRACSLANESRAFDCVLEALAPEDQRLETTDPTTCKFVSIEGAVPGEPIWELHGWKVFKAPGD